MTPTKPAPAQKDDSRRAPPRRPCPACNGRQTVAFADMDVKCAACEGRGIIPPGKDTANA